MAVVILTTSCNTVLGQNKMIDSLIGDFEAYDTLNWEKVLLARDVIWRSISRAPDSCWTYLNKVKEIGEITQDSAIIIEASFIEGVLEKDLNRNYKKSKALILQYVEYYERNYNEDNLNRTWIHLSSLYSNTKEYEKCIYYTIRAKDYEPTSNYRMHLNLTKQLSTSYNQLGWYDKTLEACSDYVHSIKVKDPRSQAMAYIRLTDAFYKNSIYDSMAIYAIKARDLKQKSNTKLFESLAAIYLGEDALNKNQLDEAFIHANKACDYFKSKKRSPLAAFHCRKLLATILTMQKRQDEATRYWNEALKIANDMGFYKDQKSILEELLRLGPGTLKQSQYEQYLDQLNQVHDTLLNQKERLAVYQIQTHYETEKKDLTIDLLNSRNDVQALQLNRNKDALLFGGIGLFLLLGLSTSLFMLLNQRKKGEVVLKQKNKIISDALAEKELLLKEIHHRVKNNLQVISSLLSIQSKFIKDDQALSAINEGRNRVKSMAIIHQDLYSKDNLMGVNLQEYFEKLFSSLFHSYKTSENRIKLDCHIDDICLDVDSIVPIGLIVNELISNALKYAFPDKREGTITVTLKESENQLLLSVKDDGIGIEDVNSLGNEESFGHELIGAFVKKLDAKLTLNNRYGTEIKMAINNYKKVA